MVTGDIGLFDIEGNVIDFKVERNDIAIASGLRSAVLLSLFTDARVELEELPPGETGQRGWWADELSTALNDRHGSKLWLLRREKQTQEVAERAREYCQQALAWLIDDGVAQSVSVATSFPERGSLLIQIEIRKPTGDLENYQFNYLWKEPAPKVQKDFRAKTIYAGPKPEVDTVYFAFAGSNDPSLGGFGTISDATVGGVFYSLSTEE